MARFILLLTITISLNCFSQTQAEMNKLAYNDFNEVDKELNETYQKILTEYQTDQVFLKNLKKSQRIWIQFRDAELAMKFPAYGGNHYGSVHPTCRAHYLKELTEKRIETLKLWLNNTQEDACSGSIKIN